MSEQVNYKQSDAELNPAIKTIIKVLRVCPAWLAVVVGLGYATGFVIVGNSLASYGIRVSGSDFWKFRYLHIGLLALSLPAILVSTALAMRYVCYSIDRDRRGEFTVLRALTTSIALLNMEIMFYVVILFMRKGSYELLICIFIILLFVLTIVGLLYLRAIETRLKKASSNNAVVGILMKPLRMLHLFLIILISDVVLIYMFNLHNGSVLYDMLYYHALHVCAFVGLTGCFGYIIWKQYRMSSEVEHHGRRIVIILLGICILMPLYYLIALSFSYGLFPFVPATRGGTDYTVGSLAVITMRTPCLSRCDTNNYMDGNDTSYGLITKHLLLIEETNEVLYFADPNDSDGPRSWRQGKSKPHILCISRSDIVRMVLDPVVRYDCEESIPGQAK